VHSAQGDAEGFLDTNRYIVLDLELELVTT
jgi:hypothetical protein